MQTCPLRINRPLLLVHPCIMYLNSNERGPKIMKYRFIGSFSNTSMKAISTSAFLAQLPFGTLPVPGTTKQTINQLYLTCSFSKQKASYSIVQYLESTSLCPAVGPYMCCFPLFDLSDTSKREKQLN